MREKNKRSSSKNKDKIHDFLACVTDYAGIRLVNLLDFLMEEY
jgi:hypothetical protein